MSINFFNAIPEVEMPFLNKKNGTIGPSQLSADPTLSCKCRYETEAAVAPEESKIGPSL